MKKYSHVIVVGIDGAGAFIKDAKTSVFDKIFSIYITFQKYTFDINNTPDRLLCRVVLVYLINSYLLITS